MAKSTRNVDACIARLLYQLPLYQDWDEVNLPKEVRQLLDTADSQRLMCIVAYSLQQLMDDERGSAEQQELIA